MTQEQVAYRVPTSVPYIGLLEAGRRHPSEKILIKLADVLGLDARELFLLANPKTRELVSPERSLEEASAWERFVGHPHVRQTHNITDEEMKTLSKVAMIGGVRSSGDFVFILKAIRQALGR